MAQTKHYHLMNGSVGCMPDNNEVYSCKKNAIEGAKANFWDVEARGMVTDLRRSGYHSFANPAQAGADYVEIVLCTDTDCDEE